MAALVLLVLVLLVVAMGLVMVVVAVAVMAAGLGTRLPSMERVAGEGEVSLGFLEEENVMGE